MTFKNGSAPNRGLVLHSCLAMSKQGLPLGIVNQQIWTRAMKADYERRKKTDRIPIEKKESFRWLKCMREYTNELRKDRNDNPSIITVADREADMFEFMEDALALHSHFVVRGDGGAFSRAIITDEKRFNINYMRYNNVADALRETSLNSSLWIEVPRRPHVSNSIGYPTRIAEVEIKCAKVRIIPSRRLLKTRKHGQPGPKSGPSTNQQAINRSLNINVIWVKEAQAPPDTEALEWFLYTDLPVESLDAAAEIIDIYKLRWQIEIFHKILKSGCRIEDCRLGSAERLKKYVTLSSVIAWRIHWMVHLNRNTPNESCDRFLTESEWKALYCRIHKKAKPPKNPPSVREAMHWIARLGGFLDRKGDSEPGIITVWRGWQRLSDIAADWKLFRSG